MGESTNANDRPSEDILAAFDRERNQIREWARRHAEQLRDSRAQDRPVYIERRRKPRL